MHTGEVTYYYPKGGYGACGTTMNNGDDIVAFAAEFFDQCKMGNFSLGNLPPPPNLKINLPRKPVGVISQHLEPLTTLID